MEIHYLRHQQIDLQRWDRAVARAANRLPYAYSWYLNAVAPGRWHGLVEGDYKRVMPLPWNAKWLGYRQLYQPPFCQQLGVFGPSVSQAVVDRFLQAIPASYRYQHLQLNAQSKPGPDLLVNCLPRTNLLIDLQPTYGELQQAYSKSLKKRLNRATAHLQLQPLAEASVLVELYREQLQDKIGLPPAHYRTIYRLIEAAQAQQAASIYGVYDQQGILCAAGFFLQAAGRIINLFGASNARGREKFAMHFLLDQVIRQHSGQPLIFDFEGSEIPGVAAFFRSFGSREEVYYLYQQDRLPAWLRLLRKWKGKFANAIAKATSSAKARAIAKGIIAFF